MVRRNGRYTVSLRGFRDFAFGNKPPDDGEYFDNIRTTAILTSNSNDR